MGAPRSERKAKKRKAEDAIPDVPEGYGDEEVQEVEVKSKKRKHSEEEGEGEAKKAKKEKREKKLAKEEKGEKTKKEKKSKNTDEKQNVEAVEEVEETAQPEGEEAPRKSKKERKAERKAKEAAERAANPPELPKATSTTAATATAAPSSHSVEGEGKSTAGVTPAKPKLDADGNPIKKKNNRNREKKRLAAAVLAASGEKAPPRFIVFVGNLPFTATAESITKHFEAVHPKSVRHLTQKEEPTKSRGCAFVEFEGYDHMKTCLKTYHHSMFDDGKSAPRKINVELTAGGGGNTKERRGKIREKNEKLMEQRTRRIGEEEKQKLVKRGVPEEDHGGIHPSRRSRVA